MWGGAGLGDSVRVRVLRFDWSRNDCVLFVQVPVSSSVTASESPDHAAAMRHRTQNRGKISLFFWFFLKGSHAHAHIRVFKGLCLQLEEGRKGRVGKHKT